MYYKDTDIMIVFLDYWDYNSKIDLWENGKALHLRGSKEYEIARYHDLFPRALSQAAVLARIFGECHEGEIS